MKRTKLDKTALSYNNLLFIIQLFKHLQQLETNIFLELWIKTDAHLHITNFRTAAYDEFHCFTDSFELWIVCWFFLNELVTQKCVWLIINISCSGYGELGCVSTPEEALVLKRRPMLINARPHHTLCCLRKHKCLPACGGGLIKDIHTSSTGMWELNRVSSSL